MVDLLAPKASFGDKNRKALEILTLRLQPSEVESLKVPPCLPCSDEKTLLSSSLAFKETHTHMIVDHYTPRPGMKLGQLESRNPVSLVTSCCIKWVAIGQVLHLATFSPTGQNNGNQHGNSMGIYSSFP